MLSGKQEGEMGDLVRDYMSFGYLTANTGNPYLEIGGVVFVVLAVSLGLRLIQKVSVSKTRPKPRKKMNAPRS